MVSGSLPWMAAIFHALSMLFVFSGALVNASRFPERYSPGKFDYSIHSHGFWHLLTTFCILSGYIGNLSDYQDYYHLCPAAIASPAL